MIVAALRDVILFAAVAFALGAACTPAGGSSIAARFAAGIALAIGGCAVAGFTGFAGGLSNPATAALVAAAGIAIIVARRRLVAAVLADPQVRQLLGVWLVFAVWALGLLALVATYSGGGWAADWLEHWQRTEFFLRRQPLTTHFAAIYTLPARPPLANALVALWLEGTAATFAHYQVFMTLLGTLVLFPAAALAQRWRQGPAVAWWTLLVLMASPLVAQNLTFAWTKLPTAFFVLTALRLCLPDGDAARGFRIRAVAALCLALATLTHYSAAPWAVAIALGLVTARRMSVRSVPFGRAALAPAAIFIVPVALWAGWAAAHFGWHGTVMSTTTAGGWTSQTVAQHLTTPLRNIVDTIVPFPLRGEPTDGLIVQSAALGRLRDRAFNLYQINLPLAFGFGGLWMLLSALARRRDAPAASSTPPADGERALYQTMIPLAIVLGVAVHTPRDHWGLAHICLQPLVLLGLARVAALLATASRRRLGCWTALATIDFALGVVLHFALESQALGLSGGDHVRRLSRAAVANANDKAAFHLEFFADALRAPAAWIVLSLALCLGFVILRLRNSPRAA